MTTIPANPSRPSLDEAWAEAEAALPGYIDGNQAEHPDEEWGHPEDYRLAVTQQTGELAVAYIYDPSTDSADPEDSLAADRGPTPAAALQALAARLREQVR